MVQGGAVREVYARVPSFVRALPFLLFIPIATALDHHAAEIYLGVYGFDRLMTPAGASRLASLETVKAIAVALTILFALRWWKFDRSIARALKPRTEFFRGLVLLLLIGGGGQLLTLYAGYRLARLLDPASSPALFLAARFGPMLLWLFFVTILVPWFIGMILEDNSMTARRSFRATRGRLWLTVGLLLVGTVPLLMGHVALCYWAIGQAPTIVWALMILDAVLIGCLTIAVASTYYTIYRRAAARQPAL